MRQILIIEDDQFIAELYKRALVAAGYEVQIQSDGKEGLQTAQTNKFDVILLDLMIPTISGSTVLNILRDPQQTPMLRAKIIVITNLEQHDKVRAEIEAQADGYLVKASVTPHQLVDYINQII